MTRPGWTSKLRLSTATVVPKRLVISRISIIVAVSCPDVVLASHATGGRPPLVGRAGHRIGSELVAERLQELGGDDVGAEVLDVDLGDERRQRLGVERGVDLVEGRRELRA